MWCKWVQFFGVLILERWYNRRADCIKIWKATVDGIVFLLIASTSASEPVRSPTRNSQHLNRRVTFIARSSAGRAVHHNNGDDDVPRWTKAKGSPVHCGSECVCVDQFARWVQIWKLFSSFNCEALKKKKKIEEDSLSVWVWLKLRDISEQVHIVVVMQKIPSARSYKGLKCADNWNCLRECAVGHFRLKVRGRRRSAFTRTRVQISASVVRAGW